jgi:hypothetical protein
MNEEERDLIIRLAFAFGLFGLMLLLMARAIV